MAFVVRRTHAFATPAGANQKIALITGGNKGIGREIAQRIGTEPDFTAIIASRDVALGQEAADALKNSGEYECEVVALPVPLDLTDDNSIVAAVKHIEQKYGRLDVLINNAAICFNDPTLYGKVEHTPFKDQADITIRTNFFGTLKVTQECLSLLKQAASPRIINVASAAGRLTILRSQELVDKFTANTLTVPQLSTLMKQFVNDVQNGTHEAKGWPNTCYGMSKLGIIALTKILARENEGMLINSVDPGYCRTDQNNNQGTVNPADGAYTPYLLALMEQDDEDDGEDMSGLHFYEEQEIPWTYQL
jgi:carbonyl reductase 1